MDVQIHFMACSAFLFGHKLAFHHDDAFLYQKMFKSIMLLICCCLSSMTFLC